MKTNSGIAGLTVRGIIHINSGCARDATAIAIAIARIRSMTGRSLPVLLIAEHKREVCHADSRLRLIPDRIRPGMLAAYDART